MTLKYALLHKDELVNLAGTILIDDKYKYYNIGYMTLPDPKDNEWNNLCFVSYTDKVIGYLDASVSRTNNIITSLDIWSVASNMKEFKVFERDLLDFMVYCLKRYPTINWSAIVNNPVRKKYRKFVKAVGGGIVGICHKWQLIQNELADAELYELLSSPEVIKKVEYLRDRIKV